MPQNDLLDAMLKAALAACDPTLCVPPNLPEPGAGRTIVIGAGKASAAMARAVEDNWDGPLEGLVITRYGHAVPCERIEIVEASHPVPDESGRRAALRLLDMLADLTPEDLVLCLISGGGSALMSAPAGDLTLEDKQAVNRSLLASGAAITEMNCVRKHLSAIKGGRLAAAAAPARIVTLLISDIPGDDPAAVASGPTVADETTSADALAIIRKYGMDVPEQVIRHLESPESETPKPDDPAFANADIRMIATPAMAIAAAARVAREAGLAVHELGDAIEGESRDVGREQAELALRIAAGEGPVAAPAVLLSGGETTVTIRGDGRGGPNAEFALSLAIALGGHPAIEAVACDTDGIDGSEDNAGARVTPTTLRRAEEAGVDAAGYLGNNDAYGFFQAIGDLVMTGPTLTNVNDFRAILVNPNEIP